MKIAFATLGCPNWKLEQIADQAKAMGYDGVELRGVAGEHVGPDETPAERLRIRKLFESRGVEIAAIMGYSAFTMTDPVKYKENIAGISKFIRLAHDLGCPVLRAFGGNWESTDRDANIARVAKALKMLAAEAEPLGVKLAIETHDAWCEGKNLAVLLKEIPSPAFGICWDVGNSFFIEPIETTYAAIKGRIVHTHIKDEDRQGEKRQLVLPGKGQVDLCKTLQLLKADGYKGYLSFEWEKKWVPTLAEPEVALPYYAKYMKDLMKEAGVER